jgi:translation initiation factor 2 beta subunit (eIF-2beta)/eIF-5
MLLILTSDVNLPQLIQQKHKKSIKLSQVDRRKKISKPQIKVMQLKTIINNILRIEASESPNIFIRNKT